MANSPLSLALAKRGGIGEIAHKFGRSLASRSESKTNPFLGVAIGGDPHPVGMGLAVEFGPLDDRITGARYGIEVRSEFLGETEDPGPTPTAPEVSREQCLLRSIDGQTSWFDRSEGRFQTNVPGLSPNLEPGSLGLPVVGGDSRFSPVVRALGDLRIVVIDPVQVARPQIRVPGRYLKLDGKNAASVLRAIEREAPDDASRVSEILRTIVPDILEVVPRSIDQFEVLEFLEESDSGRRRFGAGSMSDGTLRALGMILTVFQPARPSLILIEEPEAGIHPGALGAIMDLIHHASRLMQVVVTTHSPDLLDAKWVEDKHLRVVTREKGSSRVSRVSEGSRRVLQKHLMGAGELLRSNALQAEQGNSEDDRPLDLFVPIP